MREITSGLSAGDLVVVNGIQRARPGQKVDPQMAETPPTATDAPAEQPAGSRTAPPKSDG
jgi:hypothetical protein